MSDNIDPNAPSLYRKEVTAERINLTLIDPKMRMGERMRRALIVPDELNNTRPLTEEEDDAIGYTNLLNKPPVYMKSKVGKKDVDLGFANYVTAQELCDAGQ